MGSGLGPFLIRAVAGSGVVQMAGMITTFLVGVQLARGLGVEGYGYYGIAMAVIAIVSIPGEFGLPKLVTREVAAASALDDLPQLFGVVRWADRISFLIALPVATAMAIVAYLASRQGTSPVAAALAIGAAIVPLVAFTKIRGAALQGLHFVVIGQLPFVLLRPLLLSLLLLALFTFSPGSNAADVMALNVFTAAAALLVAQFSLRTRLPKPRPAALVQTGRRWLASALPMAMTDGMRMLEAQVAILILGIMTAPEQVGLFRVAVSTVTMVGVPLALINVATAPVLARLHAEGDTSRLQRLTSRSAQMMTAGVLALALPVILAGPQLLSFVFGSAYAPAYPALALLCLGQLVNAGFGSNGNLLVMSGHERRVTRATAVALLVGTAAVVGLVPWLGIVGAAGASVLSLLIWNVMTWNDARKLVGVDTSVWKPLRTTLK